MRACPAGIEKSFDLGLLFAEESCPLGFALTPGFVALGLAALTMFAEQVRDDGSDGRRHCGVDDEVAPVALRFVGHGVEFFRLRGWCDGARLGWCAWECAVMPGPVQPVRPSIHRQGALEHLG